jgi:hypothetical protein
MTARVFVISPSNSRLRETMPISSDFRREGNTIPTMTVCKENRALTEQDLHHQDSYQNQKTNSKQHKSYLLVQRKILRIPVSWMQACLLPSSLLSVSHHNPVADKCSVLKNATNHS